MLAPPDHLQSINHPNYMSEGKLIWGKSKGESIPPSSEKTCMKEDFLHVYSYPTSMRILIPLVEKRPSIPVCKDH
jgi:hypothetical protein